jgi:hypothetical protein
MRTLAWILVPVGFIAFAAFVLFPKDVGGPLCGPVCPSQGLHTYERSCMGIVVKEEVIDSFSDVCYGIPYGGRRCYGTPFGAAREEGFSAQRLACDYPCGDDAFRASCAQGGGVTLPGGETVDCAHYQERCGW